MYTCFFTGHRDAPESLLPSLKAAVEGLLQRQPNVRFVAGHYGRFDALAARAVGQAKERYAQASLYLLLPYHPAERPLPLPTGFDGTFYPEGMESVPKRLAISRANRWMVGHSDYLIAWAWRPGNARSVLDAGEKRARQGLLHIIRLPREGGSTQ